MKKIFCQILLVINSFLCFGQSFLNPSVESWAAPGICETNTPPDGWTDYSNGGIGPDEGKLTLCPSTIPPVASDGTTYARMMAGTPVQGEGMYQYVTGFTIGTSYIISYDYCGSNLWGGTADCVWHLFLDDIDTNQSAIFSSGSSAWQTNYFTFTASMTTHKLGVRAYTPTFGSPGSAAIDNFTISTSEPTGIESNSAMNIISVFPNPVDGELKINVAGTQGIFTFTLFDLASQKIIQQTVLNSCYVGTGMLSSGIYFYELRNETGIIVTGKIIKN